MNSEFSRFIRTASLREKDLVYRKVINAAIRAQDRVHKSALSTENGQRMDGHTQNQGQDTHNGDICTHDVHTGVGNVKGTYIGTYNRTYEEPRFKMKASERQVGGKHYTKLAIQPGEYAMANSLNYYQSLCLRYMTRYRDKNGAEDLDKAIHCLQLLREHEYG